MDIHSQQDGSTHAAPNALELQASWKNPSEAYKDIICKCSFINEHDMDNSLVNQMTEIRYDQPIYKRASQEKIGNLYIVLQPQNVKQVNEEQIKRFLYLKLLSCLYFDKLCQKLKNDYKGTQEQWGILINISKLFDVSNESRAQQQVMDLLERNLGKFNKNQSMIASYFKLYTTTQLENILVELSKVEHYFDNENRQEVVKAHITITYCICNEQQEYELSIQKQWITADPQSVDIDILVVYDGERIYIKINQLLDKQHQKSEELPGEVNVQNLNNTKSAQQTSEYQIQPFKSNIIQNIINLSKIQAIRRQTKPENQQNINQQQNLQNHPKNSNNFYKLVIGIGIVVAIIAVIKYWPKLKINNKATKQLKELQIVKNINLSSNKIKANYL